MADDIKTETSEDKTTIEAIHRLMPEINETKEKIKVLREQLRDVLEQNDEYTSLADEISQLSNKRVEAKKILASDRDYQKVNADLDDYKLKLKDLQEIMSHYLVTYYNETRSTRIRDNDGETRSVILSAKIGKPEADMEA